MGRVRVTCSTIVCLIGAGVALSVGIEGCRPSDILRVPPPAGVTASTAYQNQSGAEALADNGKANVFQGFSGLSSGDALLQWSGVLTDEYTWSNFSRGGGAQANIDARMTAGSGGFQEPADQALVTLMDGRITLLAAVAGLKQFEPAGRRTKIGEAYALLGYTELLMAEDYCAGVPLGQLVAGVGPQYGSPITTDSLLGVAEADFDSAVSYAMGSDTVRGLASVGLARTRLARGHYATAATAVSGVPTSFVYNAELQPTFGSGGPGIVNVYAYQLANGCGVFSIADREGGTGLNFVSAQDPRLVVDSTLQPTCDGGTWYYPVKFGVQVQTFVPLATGVEARLIEADAALQANQPGSWATQLRALRADTADTHVMFPSADSLPADSAETASHDAQVALMFRERAFWLFGTGTRLGDLRRLIRQYGRDQSTVFPTGPYAKGSNPGLPTPLPNYGTDVSLTLPTPAGRLTDPNTAYKGCLTSTKQA